MALESGAGAFMQNNSYAAAQTRRAVFSAYARTSANTPGLLSGGLFSAADMQLSNAVSGLVVNISTGECLIPGTESSQGAYYAFNISQSSVTLATANGSNPRIDLICVTADDGQYTAPSGGTLNTVTIQAVTGTPTSGASLSNLSGVGSLPASSLLLGYVLVPAAATSLTSGDIKNVASAAALQFQSLAPYPGQVLAKLQYNPSGSLNYSTGTGTVAYIDSTNLVFPVFTVPASGNVRVRWSATADSASTGDNGLWGVGTSGPTVLGYLVNMWNSATSADSRLTYEQTLTGLTPGASETLYLLWQSAGMAIRYGQASSGGPITGYVEAL